MNTLHGKRQNPIVIGSRREVFWEDSLIEKSRTTAEHRIH